MEFLAFFCIIGILASLATFTGAPSSRSQHGLTQQQIELIDVNCNKFCQSVFEYRRGELNSVTCQCVCFKRCEPDQNETGTPFKVSVMITFQFTATQNCQLVCLGHIDENGFQMTYGVYYQGKCACYSDECNIFEKMRTTGGSDVLEEDNCNEMCRALSERQPNAKFAGYYVSVLFRYNSDFARSRADICYSCNCCDVSKRSMMLDYSTHHYRRSLSR